VIDRQIAESLDIKNLANEILHGKGYVIIPDLLNKEEAAATRSLIFNLAEHERQQNKLISQGHKERVYGLIYKGKIFESLVQNPTLLSVVESILGEDIILGGFSAHILHPGARRMGIHVDYPYWAMSPPFPTSPVLEIQVIWLMEDFTANNGAPLFVADSQKLADKPNSSKFEELSQKITGPAGAAIISHGLCWHDTSVNNSDRPRISLLGNYTPQYIHPLEDNLFDYQSEVIERASPKLKQLLRHNLKPPEKQAFDMNPKL
jgi:ectoine hydroxylase-related dioxygenase (phytanoyl-CoA dioxygenase family)